MIDMHTKISGTVIATGIVTALVSAILYFMALPIFDATDLAWTFVIGLIAAAVSALTVAVRIIWDNEP